MPELQDTREIARHSVCVSEDLADGVTISGIAIGEGDVTVGKSGTKKYWSKDALQEAAPSLEGQPLVVDHNNTSRATVGNITTAAYEEGVGVLYEATLFDEELAEKIENGLLEVSIRGRHEDTETMEENEEGAKVVTRLQFENLSIVPQGAAPSNSVEIGPSTEISAEECAELIGGGGGPPEGAEEDVEDPKEEAEEQPERASSEDLSRVEEKVDTLLEGDEEESGEEVEPESIDNNEDDTNMTEDDPKVEVSEDELHALRADRERLEELQEEEAERAEELSALREEFGEDLEELKERTSVLDEVSRERVEELRDTADPVVMAGADYENLESQVDSIRKIYSEKLAENSDLLTADDVSDKFTVEEMAEKLESLYGEEYEEELSPNPRSQDPDEEELEERAEEGEEEELAEEVSEEQERLRQSMFN